MDCLWTAFNTWLIFVHYCTSHSFYNGTSRTVRIEIPVVDRTNVCESEVNVVFPELYPELPVENVNELNPVVTGCVTILAVFIDKAPLPPVPIVDIGLYVAYVKPEIALPLP